MEEEKNIEKTSLHKIGLKATSFICFLFKLYLSLHYFKKFLLPKKLNYIEPEDNLVDFPEKFLNLRVELNFKHEALLEDKEVEKRVAIYDGLVEKGVNLTPMEFMIIFDRIYIFKYPVLNAGELFELGSIQSKFLAKKLWSPWMGDDVVSKETMDFLSFFFGEDVSLFSIQPILKRKNKKKFLI